MRTRTTNTLKDRPVGPTPFGYRDVWSGSSRSASVPYAHRQPLLTAAAQEAEALAWTTPFPALFLPALVEEKYRAALAQLAKQHQVTRRTSRLWEDAARGPGVFSPRSSAPVSGGWHPDN